MTNFVCVYIRDAKTNRKKNEQFNDVLLGLQSGPDAILSCRGGSGLRFKARV